MTCSPKKLIKNTSLTPEEVAAILEQMSDPQEQSLAHVEQFSPAKLAQMPSPHTGLHKPL